MILSKPRRAVFCWWLLVLGLVAGAGLAQDGDLRRQLEESFLVDRAPGGVELVPKGSFDGVRSIRVEGSEIRINGAKVKEVVLAAWLPEAAPLLRRLSALSGAEQRTLFGLSTEELSLPAPPVAVEAPEPPAVSEIPQPPPQPESPPEVVASERRSRGGQFILFDDLEVVANESVRDAVAVFGSVTVDGEVRSDVTAVLGSVYVEGEVGGEVVAVNGSVHLGPRSHVVGNVTAVGGVVERAEGARVDGAQTQVPFGTWSWRDGDGRGRTWQGPLSGWWWSNPLAGLFSLFWRLMVLGFFVLVLCLTLLLAPGPIERAERRLAAEPVKAGLVGFLGLFVGVLAFALAMVILAITILGIALIPVLLIAALVVALVASLLGYTAACLWVGKLVNGRLRWNLKSSFGQLLLGFGALELVGLAGGSLQAIGGLLHPLGWVVSEVGDLIQLVAFFVGLGGVILVRYGRYFDSRLSEPLPIAAAPPAAPPAA